MESAAHRPSRLRGVLAIALVVLASVSFLFAGVGTWMQRSTLEKDVWEQRVGTLGEDEAVQKALSAWVTQQLLATIDTQRLVDEHVADRSGRLTTAIANRAADRLDEYLASGHRVQLVHRAQRGGLARSGQTHHHEDLTLVHPERHVGETHDVIGPSLDVGLRNPCSC